MSEDLTNYKAATSIEQNSTQEGVFPPFHLSLSIGSLLFQCSLVEGNIHAGLTEKTKTHKNLSESCNCNYNCNCSCNWDFPVNTSLKANSTFSDRDVQRILKNHAIEDSPGPESAQKEVSSRFGLEPEVTEEKPIKEKDDQMASGDPDWLRDWDSISDHPRLRWKTEGEVLHCSYSMTRMKTTWEEVERISKLDYRQRSQKIRKIVGNGGSKNLRTCLSLLARLYAAGKIKMPAKKAERKVKAAAVPKMVTPTDPKKLPKVK